MESRGEMSGVLCEDEIRKNKRKPGSAEKRRGIALI